MAACAALSSLSARAEEIAPGLSMEAIYVADLLGTVSGGEKTGAAWLGRGDVIAELDGGIIGLEGAKAFVDVMYTHGPAFSERHPGDGQGISGIEGDRRLKIAEAWVAFPLVGESLKAQFGVTDLNNAFDVQNAGTFFLNGSHGMGPDFSQSGINGPSTFPFTSVGAIVNAEGKDWTARVAMFDPVAGGRRDPGRTVFRLPGADGALIAAEGDVRLGSSVVASVGAWTYTTRFDAIAETAPDGSPLRLRRSRGAYAAIEASFATGQDSAVEGWLRVGVADERVNSIGSSISGGIIHAAGSHTVGIAVAHARLGDPAIEASRASGTPAHRAETVLELSYGWQLNDRLSLQPDVQYVINPGWKSDRPDALVIGLRVQATLF